MAEIKTAEGSDGVVKPVVESTPKSGSDKHSGRTGSSGRVKTPQPPKLNERGVPVTQWDDSEGDPNQRKSIQDDPTGESNSIPGH